MALIDILSKKIKGLNTGGELKPLERVSTGIASLDVILGGGLPLRRVIQIYGPESAGKSMLALNLIKNICGDTEEAIYIDMESTVTLDDIQDLGLNPNSVIFYNAHGGEDAYDTALDALEAGAKIAVIDSVPYLRPKKVLEEIDKCSEYKDVSAIANLMERVQSKIVNTLRQTDGILIFINQQRPAKGQYEAPSYPGGSALKFMLSLDIQVTGSKDRDNPNLVTQKVLVRKNKTFIPLTKTEVYYKDRLPLYGKCLADVCIDSGLITQKGAWAYLDPVICQEVGLPEGTKWQGKDKTGEALTGELYEKLYDIAVKQAVTNIKPIEIEELDLSD
jgi:recombination protein RecA